jgi:predicted nicotinamide N-methyase
METKRRITAALFALLPVALDAAPAERQTILDMIHEYDQSYRRATARLEPAGRPAAKHLRRLWRDGQVLETYLPEPALRKAA